MFKEKYNPFAFANIIKFLSISFICVFTHMLEGIAIKGDIPLALTEIPAAFVEFFFVISGMFFYQFYYHKLYEGELGKITFFKKRIKRIYPIVILSLLFCVVLHMLVYKQFYFDFLSFIITATLGSDCIFSGINEHTYNGAFWYIGVLMLCYLIAVIIMVINKHFKIKSPILFIIPVLVGISILTLPSLVSFPFYNEIVCRGYFAFFLGILLMYFLGFFSVFSNRKKIIIRIIFSIICCASFTLAIICFANPDKYVLVYSKSVFALFFFAPLIVVLYDLKPVNALLSNKLVASLGQFSFIMYAFNYPIRFAFTAIDNTYSWINSLGYCYMPFDYVIHLLVTAVIFFSIFGIKNMIKAKSSNNSTEQTSK